MSIPGLLLPHKVEQGLVSILLPRPPQPHEESGPVRIDKVQKKNLPKPPLLHKGHPCQHRHGQPGQDASYSADKTIFRASPARDASLGVDRLL